MVLLYEFEFDDFVPHPRRFAAGHRLQGYSTAAAPSGGQDPALNEMLEAAREYALLGWPVFPCAPGGKTPLTRNGFKDATVVPDVIGRWWARWPQANIGIRTGIAFDALDIDGDEGLAALATVVPASKLKLLGGVVCDPVEVVEGPIVTSGKGWHVYATATGYGNRAGILPRVDWRGAGGYVIAPPSVHPTGARYWWRSDEPGAPPEVPIRPPPGWWPTCSTRRQRRPCRRGRHPTASPCSSMSATPWPVCGPRPHRWRPPARAAATTR